MNKVLNINLGGIAFTIDQDAYDYLSKYLDTINRHFRHSEGHEEIVTDIEARLGELFKEIMGGKSIVTMRTVQEAIGIMGTPEEFGATADEGTPHEQSSSTRSRRTDYKTGRKLYRDPENEVIGGVCSGIAAYFGIEDPLWIRIAFVVAVFGFGFSLLPYLILWALIPAAKSASDRLAMRGEPINVSNIGKIIEEEMGEFGRKMEDFGEEFSEKWDKDDWRKEFRETWKNDWSKSWERSKKKAPQQPGQSTGASSLEVPLPKGFIF